MATIYVGAISFEFLSFESQATIINP